MQPDDSTTSDVSSESPAKQPSKYQLIYQVVAQVPSGCVATYGQIAELAGLGRRQARMVGYALHNCPKHLPWHRIINAKGQISLPADSTVGMRQRRLLQDEGIVFLGARIDLKRFGWQA